MSSYKSVFRVILVLALCVCGYSHGVAEGSYAKVFGNNYTITHSEGGNEDTFEWAAAEVLEFGLQVKIDGLCTSSCAVFAQLARPNVCITKRALFGFHLATGTTPNFVPRKRGKKSVVSFQGYTVRYEVSHQKLLVSPDIQKWIEDQAPLTTDRVLYMTARKAAKFWPMCK